MSQSQSEQVKDLIRRHGVLRPRDLDVHGIPRECLRRMQRRGLVERIGRGLYILAGSEVSEHHSLAVAAKSVPGATVCLLSALRFHDLTTQLPHAVWLAIGPKARQPKGPGLRLRVVRFSGSALNEGIELHRIEGVRVPVYAPGKTVADCFKFRRKLGLDVALEALRECWRERRADMDELWHFAKICRVANVMRPYLESLE
jgi:predicted transcriptional regulator of viral defense system